MSQKRGRLFIIIQKEGRYYGVIYSLSNSAYTVIYNEKTFTDITNHWAKTSIEDMAARLILQGVTEQQFQPNKEITRAEFTGIIERALGLHTIEQYIEFQDVQKKESRTAAALNIKFGIINGSNDSVSPGKIITRAETAIIIQRFLQKEKLI